MAEIKKEMEIESFKNKEVCFNVANIKKELDVSIAETRQKVNAIVVENNEKMNVSLVKIKTEHNWIADCDIAPATVHLMHQEVNSFETMLTAVKEGIDSDTDISDNTVTVNLLIPETILTVKTEVDKQASQENQLANLNAVDSDRLLIQPELAETRENSIHLDISSDIIPENTSVQSVLIGSTKRQRRKRKNDSDFCDLESLLPQSSTTRVKPVKKCQRKSAVKEKNVAEVTDSDDIDLESPTPSSAAVSEIVLGSQISNKRGKKGSVKNKKERDIKMVVCPFCDRKMVKHYFPYHARRHTDEKPFKCPKCPYTSHFKGTLNFHMKSHHPTEGYLIPEQ